MIRLFRKSPTLVSKVPGQEGECTPIWINRNQVENKFDGGITGTFRLKQGDTKEFSGILVATLLGTFVHCTCMECWDYRATRPTGRKHYVKGVE